MFIERNRMGITFNIPQAVAHVWSSAKMYGKITTHAVQKTMTAWYGNRTNRDIGVSVRRTQMERKATEKKWVTRTRGCLIKPARRPIGPPTGPTWK